MRLPIIAAIATAPFLAPGNGGTSYLARVESWRQARTMLIANVARARKAFAKLRFDACR